MRAKSSQTSLKNDGLIDRDGTCTLNIDAPSQIFAFCPAVNQNAQKLPNLAVMLPIGAKEAGMRYLQAALSIGFFGWIGYAIFAGGAISASGLLSISIEQFGSHTTAVAIICLGAVTAVLFVARAEEQ